MTIYLIKSTGCLLILFGIYQVLLSSEKMPRFNRFYLLFSLVFSFLSPLISINLIEIDPAIAQIAEQTKLSVLPNTIPVATLPQTQPEGISYDNMLVFCYSLGFVFMLFRFVKNLLRLFKIVKNSKQFRQNEVLIVLTKQPIQLCTFAGYVFVNEDVYHKNGLELELLSHEMSHARQWHSLDIVLIEILLVFCWFNPLLYLYKKAIQLNHEFLADDFVINQYQDVRSYQELLLQKIIVQPSFQLTNSLTFQLTKQRFTMMTKTTSARKAFVRKAMLIPVFVLLALGLGTYTMAQKQATITQSPTKQGLKQGKLTQKDVNLENAMIIIMKDFDKNDYEKPKKGSNVLRPKKNSYKYSELSEELKAKLGNPVYFEKNEPTQEMMDNWAKSSEKLAFWLDGKRIANAKVGNYKPTDIAHYFISSLSGAARIGKRRYQINLDTHKGYENYIKEVKNKPMFIIDLQTKK